MAAWAVDQAAGVLYVIRSFRAASSFTHASETEQKSQAGKQQTCGEKSLMSTEWTCCLVISSVWWMWTALPEQVIQIQFTVQCNMSWNLAQIGWINVTLVHQYSFSLKYYKNTHNFFYDTHTNHTLTSIPTHPHNYSCIIYPNGSIIFALATNSCSH